MCKFHGHKNYSWVILLTMNKGNKCKFMEYSVEIFIDSSKVITSTLRNPYWVTQVIEAPFDNSVFYF